MRFLEFSNTSGAVHGIEPAPLTTTPAGVLREIASFRLERPKSASYTGASVTVNEHVHLDDEVVCHEKVGVRDVAMHDVFLQANMRRKKTTDAPGE